MQKTLLSSGLILMLVLVLLPGRSAVTAGGFDWSSVALDESESTTEVNDDSSDTANATPKKKGNGFVRALGAPFRALGRLFGGGKKNDQQAKRTSEKDASKFESKTFTRIKDGSVQPSTASNGDNATPTDAFAVAASPVDVHIQKGRELLVAGNVDGAIAELSAATAINPKSGEANKLLGIAYESKGFRDRALQSFEVALHSDEDNAEHLNNLGFLLYKNGDYEKATKYLKKAAKKRPNDARIWNNLALTQCQRGKFDDAFESFGKAVGEFGAHLNIAAQLQSRGYAKDAIKHLEKAQAMRPNSVDVLSKLVALYEMTGRPTDAEAARRSIVALKTFADANK
jgi:Flp pilus assembly protein TadD